MPDSKKPHDALFKAAFSQRKVMLDYLRQFLPKKIWEDFDLRTLKRSPDSYIDEKLEESLSDIVYTCIWQKKKPVRICLLLEHKSYLVKYPHIQMLRYMVNIWEKDLEAKQAPKVVIPIILYHDKREWQQKPFADSFGEAGIFFHNFIPQFDYHLTDLSKYSDDTLVKLRKSFLINSLLALKHKREAKYIQENIAKILIYIEEIENPWLKDRYFQQIFTYIVLTNKNNDLNLKVLIKNIPIKLRPMADTIYDSLIKQGLEQGLEEKLEQQKQIIRNLIQTLPDFDNEAIANLAEASLDLVEEIRKELKNSK